MIRTAIFSGSFNPIHIGHLMLANYIVEYENVDEFWFVLSPQNPLKKQAELSDDQLRLEMLRSAVSEYPRFYACDIELSLPKPSYTVYTLQALNEKYPDREFILIIGADNWLVFDRWKDYQTIWNTYRVWIYPRPGYDLSDSPMPFPPLTKVISSPVFDISSTRIRRAISEGKDMKAFLPRPAYEMIKERKLYR
ncbi:MAG: nicotinate (nicotinamide) nucleotide adenylyltransferase [Candidatus Azobacteroides sp.]|nr:nicotinate (nicotinamide) nucleotide adenylyltransferase [Candidatus Azobacteroides sp.]